MKKTTQELLAVMFVAGFTLGGPASAEAEGAASPGAEDAAAQTSEPTLDELLGLDSGGNNKPEVKPDADNPAAEDDKATDPQLTRDLQKRLSGEEASQQFEQAIQEMKEVAIRLGEEADAGIDTQRMQDQIILKLEQIIASAEKSPSQSQSSSSSSQKPGQARQADKGGKPKPGQQQGAQPGQGQKPQPGGQQAGQKPGEKPGDQQGNKPGDQPGQQANGQQPGQQAGNQGSPGSVNNQELSMKELREGEWGNLPPRLRDELSESLSETFNPVYRAATEAFYRRIAELSQQQAEEHE